MKNYIVDKRYIKIDEAPIILVYKHSQIPNVRDVLLKWRKHAIQIGIGKIIILVCNTFEKTTNIHNINDIVDGYVDFPPHNIQIKPIYVNTEHKNTEIANIFSYEDFVLKLTEEIYNEKKINISNSIQSYHTCMMGWDNSARKKKDWYSFVDFSLESLYKWASLLVTEALEKNKQMFFINAWNEWAEGTYLEPDMKYGYANINTLSKAIYGFPLSFKPTSFNSNLTKADTKINN
jgi:hypothetical protein